MKRFIWTAVFMLMAACCISQEHNDVTGTWKGPVAFAANPADIELTLVLEEKERKLTGHISSENGTLENVPIKDVKVEKEILSFAFEHPLQSVTVAFRMTVEDNSMKGEVEVVEAGDTGTWTAKKQTGTEKDIKSTKKDNEKKKIQQETTVDLNLEKEAIKKAVIDGYINGVFFKGDPEMVKNNWHKDCDILVFRKGKMVKRPISGWIERLIKNPGPSANKITYEFAHVRVTGYAATVVVKIFNNNKTRQIYTDYLSLYKFEDGWKIVAKTYYGHSSKYDMNSTMVNKEKEAVKKAIIDGYIKGVFLKGDPELIKKSWYESCDIAYFEPKSRKLIKGSAVKYFENYFEKKPGPFNENITYEFTDVTVSGYAAVAIVEIYNKDKSKHIYTDYLCLYRFDDGWKIATKTYYDYR